MRRRRRILPRYSAREWAVRGTLAAIALVVGGFSVAHSLAQVVVKNDPAFAYSLAPWDGRITAAYAATFAGPDASDADRQRSDALAKKALRQDPTAVVAASTLGVNAQMRGDTELARRYFTYAQKLSRRDLTTQLWFIEEAVSRGDTAAALHHYDIALRTKAQSWDTLFPILTGASADAGIRRELVKTLAGKPLWGEHFINHVAANPADPKAVSTLLLEVRRAGVPVPDSAHAAAINALIGKGLVQEAWGHYAEIRVRADQRRSRDPKFAATSEAPTPFDWNPVNDGTVTTSLQRGSGATGVFDFFAPTSTGGTLLQQVQLLPPGKYRLTGRSASIEQAPGSEPYWLLSCRADGRELGRVAVPNSSRAAGQFAGDLTVPAGCPVQVLALVARSSDAVAGLTGQIQRAELGPVR